MNIGNGRVKNVLADSSPVINHKGLKCLSKEKGKGISIIPNQIPIVFQIIFENLSIGFIQIK